MNDYDSIKGIFSKKNDITTSFTKDGFNYESNNDYYQARKCYMDALNTDWDLDDRKVSKLEKELWEQSLLRCSNELNDWKSMIDWCLEDKGTLNDLFKDDYYSLENIFPYAFRSKIKLILQEDEEEQQKHADLIKFIQTLDADGKLYLQEAFSQELALISLHQKDYNAAKYYANKAIQNYLKEWSVINKTVMQGRMTKLQSLQTIVELNEFLKFVDSNPFYTSDLNKKVDNLINLWSYSMPNMFSDPPCTWDDVITNRCIYYEFIEDKYYTADPNKDVEMSSFAIGLEDDHEEEAKKKLLRKMEKSKILMKIKFAQAAQFQGNNKLALMKLAQTRSVVKSQSRHLLDLQITWTHCYLKTHLARAKLVNDSEEGLNMFIGALALKEITKYDSSQEFEARNDLHQDHQILHGQFSKFLIESLIRIENTTTGFFEGTLQADEKKSSSIKNYLQTSDSLGLVDTISKLMKQGVENLTKLDRTNSLRGSLELSTYCDHFLRLVENDEGQNSSSLDLSRIEMIKSEFPSIVIEELLNAISLNSYEARLRFPRLLQIVEAYKNKVLDVFLKSSANVPSWMFIRWLSQMTALLDKPEAKAVYKIIENITNDYPQAIVYPFKMSLEGFKFDFETKEQKEFVEKIKDKIKRIPLVNQFIAALEQLNNPDLLFADYLNSIMTSSKEKYFAIFKEFYFNMIDNSSEDSSFEQVDWGNIRKTFAKYLKPRFEAEFGENGQLIGSLAESAIKEKMKKIRMEVNEFSKNIKDGNMGEYSPWLKTFKRNLAKDLEIPGQYNGKNKPLPEYHVKIESFDERITVMTSLRRPKCIIIRGDDQKDHKFLVKAGEDQRQDDRIETLFELINDLLKADSRCYQRNLSIKTYQVVPMTTKLALIEWIADTKTLKSVINDSKTEEELKEWASKNPDEIYYKYINEVADENTNMIERFGLVHKKFKRSHVCNTFKGIENLVPRDLLRRYVRSMASNTEGYFVLRNQFVTSYAVASMCQYILGIGDRHLSNWMIDTKSGKAIAIDFGMAFGYATLNLG